MARTPEVEEEKAKEFPAKTPLAFGLGCLTSILFFSIVGLLDQWGYLDKILDYLHIP